MKKLSHYAVAQKLVKVLAKQYGMDFAEFQIISGKKSQDMFRTNGRHVAIMCEEGPFEWAIDVSLGDMDSTRFIRDNDCYTEAWNSFTLMIFDI